MKIFIKDNAPKRFLRKIFCLMPFDLKGGLTEIGAKNKLDFVSCLICTARGPQMIKTILSDLFAQTLEKTRFEIVILNDSTEDLKPTLDHFSKNLSISYLHNNDATKGRIGFLRNQTLANSQGEYILFLDDDTRLLQTNFLEKSIELFKETGADVILPKAIGMTSPKDPTYHYLDDYSTTNRCCLYRREILKQLSGFQNDIASYEDIELSIRLTLKCAKILKTDELTYAHPSLYFDSLKKPLSIGQSIFKLRRYYPWPIWLMIYFNALRFLPYCLLPTKRNMQWFKISLGVLLAPFIKKEYTY